MNSGEVWFFVVVPAVATLLTIVAIVFGLPLLIGVAGAAIWVSGLILRRRHPH